MNSERSIKIAILGLGTVGGGTYKLLKEKEQEFKELLGLKVIVEKILVRDMSKQRPYVDSSILTNDWTEICNNQEIELVVELLGGIEPSKTYVLEALERGKSVVTANKNLIAECGAELFDKAKENGCDLYFEAAVCGAIPIIRALKEGFSGDDIREITGIVNGTTNYIMTKMTEEGKSYNEALEEATSLGYAELDPTDDVEGYDAGRKMLIMACISFHSRFDYSDVNIEGITNVTQQDIFYAKEFGYVIKLLGRARNDSHGVDIRVNPMLIPIEHPLASIRDSFNAVYVKGAALGEAMFLGQGAGELPTASAVVGDIVDVCRDIIYHSKGRMGCSCYKKLPLYDSTQTQCKYFLCIQTIDKPGALANIAGAFEEKNVSIEKMVQKTKVGNLSEIAIITDEAEEKYIIESIKSINSMDIVKRVTKPIRVY